MDSDDGLDAAEPPAIDPYTVLGLDRTNAPSTDQIRSAYRKAALRCHPDKVAPEKRETAHVQFQEVAFAYAVLSDPARRKRYDETGSTAESIVDSDGFSWSDFYRAAFADAVNPDAIEAFAAQYKHSDEERDDLLAAYTQHKGSMDGVYESVMLSNVLVDDERFRSIIDEAIKTGTVKSFRKYTHETATAKKSRLSAAKNESREAEEYAKELGVHDKLFGSNGDTQKGESTSKNGKAETNKARGKGSKSKVDDSQAGLAALIQKRQQDRSATFLDNLAAKYGATAQRKHGSKKRQAAGEDEIEDEPSEEAFQAAAARLKNGKQSGKKSRR